MEFSVFIKNIGATILYADIAQTHTLSIYGCNGVSIMVSSITQTRDNTHYLMKSFHNTHTPL